MGIAAAFVYKRRHSDTSTEVLAINASVKGKHVVIYDDMIRTGSSLLSAAQAYFNEGAKKISAITTHGLFNENALEKIAASGLIDKIICFNTHPKAVTTGHKLLTVKSIAPLIIKKLTDEGASN
jgi:ribose-phosphate pyrophosphokinase